MNFRRCPHPECDAELLVAAGTPEGERARCGECKRPTVWREGELVAVPECCVVCSAPVPPDAPELENGNGDWVVLCEGCRVDARRDEAAEVESERRNGHLSL